MMIGMFAFSCTVCLSVLQNVCLLVPALIRYPNIASGNYHCNVHLHTDFDYKCKFHNHTGQFQASNCSERE